MMKPEPSAIRWAAFRGTCGKRCRWPPGPCCSKKRRRNWSNGELGNPGEGANSGSSDMAAASARRDTDIFTTAGETFLTRGARLWCWISAIGDVIVCDVVCGGLPAAGGFSAQTKGDRARVAPRPKPIAAERFRFSQGEPARSFSNSLISSPPKRSLCRRSAAELERIAVQLMQLANRRLSHGLIRRNFGAGSSLIGCQRSDHAEPVRNRIQAALRPLPRLYPKATAGSSVLGGQYSMGSIWRDHRL